MRRSADGRTAAPLPVQVPRSRFGDLDKGTLQGCSHGHCVPLRRMDDAGEPEIRGNVPSVGFNPYPRWTDGATTVPPGPPVELQPQREQPPAIDSLEAFLVATFLRRYVTY